MRAASRPAVRLLVAALVAALAAPGLVRAQDRDTGGGGGLIGLSLPVGARTVGQGRAAVAAAGDLQALPYNPAVLAALERGALTFSRYEAAEATGLTSNFVAGAWTTSHGTFAVQGILHDMGEIPVTDDSPQSTSSIDVGEYAIGLSYANTWRRGRLAIGATAKLYTSDLGETQGSTPAFDVGLVWSPRPSLPLDIAVALRNLGPDLEYDATSTVEDPVAQRLPSRFRVGIGFRPDRFLGLSEAYSVRLFADSENDLEELSTTDLHAGVVVTARDVIVFRAGALLTDNPYVDRGDGNREAGGAFGIGIRYEGFEADVSREVSVSELGDETHFSVGYRF